MRDGGEVQGGEGSARGVSECTRGVGELFLFKCGLKLDRPGGLKVNGMYTQCCMEIYTLIVPN